MKNIRRESNPERSEYESILWCLQSARYNDDDSDYDIMTKVYGILVSHCGGHKYYFF
jgi:hypothetical protein